LTTGFQAGKQALRDEKGRACVQSQHTIPVFDAMTAQARIATWQPSATRAGRGEGPRSSCPRGTAASGS
jgi:hypothetical protein